MYPCPYIKKSVNSLSRIILKIQSRNNINYQTVRMSDLRDELYKEDGLADNKSSQSQIDCNKQVVEFNNEKKEIKHGKKQIIIRIKICNIPDNDGTENDALIKTLNKKNGSFNKFQHFESEISDRTYTIELTECANILPQLDYNENSLIKDYEGLDENDSKVIGPVKENLKVPKHLNYKNNQNENIDNNSTMYIVDDSYKSERNETFLSREQIHVENLTIPPKEVNNSCNSVQNKNDVAIATSEQNKCIYSHSDENEDNSNTNNIQKHLESKRCKNDIPSEQLVKSDAKNTYEETITETLAEISQSGKKCYVIDINIPKDGKSEDELNKQVVKKIKSLQSLDNSNNIGFINDESIYYIVDNENCSLKHNNKNEKTLHYDYINDTEKRKETLYNNEINIAKSSTTTSKFRNADKQEKDNFQRRFQLQEKDKTNSLIVKQDKTKNSGVQCLPDKEKIKDSLIIKDIVMKKYGETLKEFMQRSLKRRQIRKRQSLHDNKQPTGSKQKLNRPMSLDIKNLQCNKDFSHLLINTRTPDSGLEATQDLDYSNCISSESFQNSNQSFKYSPTMFLKEALGDEYMNLTFDSDQESLHKRYSTPMPESYKQYSNGRSIGSSEISTLISTTVDSLYSTIDKSKKRQLSVLKKTSALHPMFSSTISDTYIYESVEKLKINPKTEELNIAISVQCAIITQVSKALSLCRQSPVFFGSIPHLEAEKYLLFATYKKIILENQLNRDYEEMESEQCYGTVNVENLRFVLNTGHAMEINNAEEYYMCLLHSDVTLLASNIVLPDKNGHIIFKQSFQFNNLMSDFEIYIKIFSMVLENKNKKILYFSPTKLRSSWRYGKTNNKRTDGLPELSSFRLIGTSKIGVSDLYKSNSLYLENVSTNGRISDTFTADIQSSIKITNNIRGFLTIGTTNVLWNRRWCTLEGPFLKYWNYPSDENNKEPIGMFDLSNSISDQVASVDKTVCSRPRVIMLQIQSEEYRTIMQYFLQADNLVEFEEWKRQLNSVLISLNNWKCLKN